MDIPLATHIDWYLASLRARSASPATIHTYRSALTRLSRYCAARGCSRIEDLTPDLVRDAAIDAMEQGARALDLGSTRTKGNEGMARMLVTAARGLLLELHTRQHLVVADLSTVPTPRLPERIQPRVDLEDFDHMEEALQRRAAYSRYSRFLLARDSALVQFLFETGLRAIEASRLNVEDLDVLRGRLTVRQGKGRKPRRMSLVDPEAPDDPDHGETLRRLRVYLAVRPRDRNRALWVGTRGARLSPGGLRDILRTLCEEAGTSILPVHAFRRGWFTAAYRSAPQDLPLLSARMGWSERSLEMVAVYTRGAQLDFASQPRPLVTRH